MVQQNYTGITIPRFNTLNRIGFLVTTIRKIEVSIFKSFSQDQKAIIFYSKLWAINTSF